MSTNRPITTDTTNRVEPLSTAYDLLEAALERSGIALVGAPTQQKVWLLDQAERLLHGFGHTLKPDDLKRLPEHVFDSLVRVALIVEGGKFFEPIPGGNSARNWLQRNVTGALSRLDTIYFESCGAVGILRNAICRKAIESRSQCQE
jgi:hypothetical protein